MRKSIALILGFGLLMGTPMAFAQEEGPGGPPPPPGGGAPGGAPPAARSTIPGFRLVATNACSRTISMAYRVQDYTGLWVTRGWFNIRPGQTRRLSMPTFNTTFYYYGFMPGSSVSWSGRRNGQPQPTARQRWIRRKRFLHASGVLTGQGARQVWFRKRQVNRATGFYPLRLTCRRR